MITSIPLFVIVMLLVFIVYKLVKKIEILSNQITGIYKDIIESMKIGLNTNVLSTVEYKGEEWKVDKINGFMAKLSKKPDCRGFDILKRENSILVKHAYVLLTEITTMGRVTKEAFNDTNTKSRCEYYPEKKEYVDMPACDVSPETIITFHEYPFKSKTIDNESTNQNL